MEINFKQYKLLISVGRILLGSLLLLIWCPWPTTHPDSRQLPPATNQRISHIDRVGVNKGRGNMLGIQPWMTPDDYRDERTFRTKLEAYLQTAKYSGLVIPQKTIIILPEYLGTWLVAVAGKIVSVEARHVSIIREMEYMNMTVFSGDNSVVEGLFIKMEPSEVLPKAQKYVREIIDAHNLLTTVA